MPDYYDPEIQKSARKSKWYEDVTRSLTKCQFCDLKEKYLICEQDNVVLTVNLFPYIDGHLMVIPRRHIASFDNITKKEWLAMQELLKIGMHLIKSELIIQNTNTLYREGAKSGMSLEHLHIHVLPITTDFMRYEKQKFVMEFQEIKFTPLEMAERLRKACKKLQLPK